jgi:hypothetical protein
MWRTDHSSGGVLPNVVRRFLWSRNVVNEEALAHWGVGGVGGCCYTKNKELISELLINDRCCGRIWCILIRQRHIIIVLADNLGYVTMTHDSEEILSRLGNPLKLIQVTSFDSSRLNELPGSMHVIQTRHIYHTKTLVNIFLINFKSLFILKLKSCTIS